MIGGVTRWCEEVMRSRLGRTKSDKMVLMACREKLSRVLK